MKKEQPELKKVKHEIVDAKVFLHLFWFFVRSAFEILRGQERNDRGHLLNNTLFSSAIANII